jgi:hypothetical protein
MYVFPLESTGLITIHIHTRLFVRGIYTVLLPGGPRINITMHGRCERHNIMKGNNPWNAAMPVTAYDVLPIITYHCAV